MAGGTEEATEDGAGAILGDTVTASAAAIAMAITGDLGMVGGVILTGGTTPTILTIPPMVPSTIPTTILLTMGVMGNRRCLHKRLPLRRVRDNSSVLIGTSVRTQKVTIPTLRIAQAVG